MDEKKMIEFLTVCAIPVHKGKDRTYDCVFRAHRDLIPARYQLKKYFSKSDGKKSYSREVIKSLYGLITKYSDTLNSKTLINELNEDHPDIGFGAIQKLVNMSLKYLLVLKKYEGHIINIDEKDCDCPLDSTILDCLAEDAKKLKKQKINEQNKINEDILNALEEKEIKWTSITKEQYDDVQIIIGFLTKDKGSKLAYDFDNWNKEKK